MEHSSDFLFYAMSLASIGFGVAVVTTPNPVMSALYLVLSMIGVSGLFFNLNAPFVAGAQIIVYAGAVLVLFLMVMMIFDLKKEKEIFTRSQTNLFKAIALGLFSGLVFSAIYFAKSTPFDAGKADGSPFPMREIAIKIFTDYLLAFEILGLLLLVIPIGVVALSRVIGGTHAK